MKNDEIVLTLSQKEIMQEFYSIAPTKVIFSKSERQKLWALATKRSANLDLSELRSTCPALEHQIRKSYEEGNNIQSAVFSECAYAQTFANMLKLSLFVNCADDPNFIPSSVVRLIKSFNLVPRYVYSIKDKSRMLIQAGGCGAVDSALVTVINMAVYTIEFKEPGAKASEPDLPLYGENGKIKVTKKFLLDYPQFEAMLNEQKGLNIFNNIGHNITSFSVDSLKVAVANNYINKYANVICTEDVNGYFVMIPANQVDKWAVLEGEIRTAGRNYLKVWTPLALRRLMSQYDPVIDGTTVKLEKSKLETRKQRGGNGKVSGYKITPIFFVYAKDCEDDGTFITFDIEKVRQLKPTIASKMFFKTLKYDGVKTFYQKLF